MNIDYILLAVIGIFIGAGILTTISNLTEWNYLW
jgi:hypothetical protein